MARQLSGCGLFIVIPVVLFAAMGCGSPPRRNIESMDILAVQYGNERFKEQHSVRPGELFTISDTEYTARVLDFVPHFERSLSTGIVTSRSNEMKNPAIKVELLLKGERVYRCWFLRDAPFHHVRRRPGFGFLVREVRFINGRMPDFTKIEIQPDPERRPTGKRPRFHNIPRRSAPE